MINLFFFSLFVLIFFSLENGFIVIFNCFTYNVATSLVFLINSKTRISFMKFVSSFDLEAIFVKCIINAKIVDRKANKVEKLIQKTTKT